jgi:hypothetical protein
MDLQRSKHTTWEGKVARVQALAIDEVRTMGMKLFRLHEYPEVILVDQVVHDALRQFMGVRLTSAEGWSDHHRF